MQNSHSSEPPFFEAYTRLAPEPDLVEALGQQLSVEIQPLSAIGERQANTVHPPYLWTIKEVVGHLIDTEIIFAYRAFRFSRNDPTPLAGFDQDIYIQYGYYNQRSMVDIAQQLYWSRQANLAFLRALPEAAWLSTGVANELTWTVTDLVRAMIGHIRHHLRIIEKRLV